MLRAAWVHHWAHFHACVCLQMCEAQRFAHALGDNLFDARDVCMCLTCMHVFNECRFLSVRKHLRRCPLACLHVYIRRPSTRPLRTLFPQSSRRQKRCMMSSTRNKWTWSRRYVDGLQCRSFDSVIVHAKLHGRPSGSGGPPVCLMHRRSVCLREALPVYSHGDGRGLKDVTAPAPPLPVVCEC